MTSPQPGPPLQRDTFAYLLWSGNKSNTAFCFQLRLDFAAFDLGPPIVPNAAPPSTVVSCRDSPMRAFLEFKPLIRVGPTEVTLYPSIKHIYVVSPNNASNTDFVSTRLCNSVQQGQNHFFFQRCSNTGTKTDYVEITHAGKLFCGQHCTENPIYVFPKMKLCGLVLIPIHSCICEQFIYSQDWSAYLAAAK